MLVLVVAGTEEGFFSTSKKASESTAETSRESWCLRSDQRFKFVQACREVFSLKPRTCGILYVPDQWTR